MLPVRSWVLAEKGTACALQHLRAVFLRNRADCIAIKRRCHIASLPTRYGHRPRVIVHAFSCGVGAISKDVERSTKAPPMSREVSTSASASPSDTAQPVRSTRWNHRQHQEQEQRQQQQQQMVVAAGDTCVFTIVLRDASGAHIYPETSMTVRS